MEEIKLYTKDQFLIAAEKCEVSMIDARHIMRYIDEYVTPIKLSTNLVCVNCDESKPTHNICMDCIIKVGKENIELPSDEEIELSYYNQLDERREIAKNFKGQVAGRHPDMFGHNEVHNMVRGYLECIGWLRGKILGDNK